VLQLKRALAWYEIEKKAAPQQGTQEDKIKQKLHELGEAEEKLALYRVDTKLKAVPWGVFLGILVSALGFRTLQPLLDPGVVAELTQFHTMFLRTTDVGLTGGLIGGGSDGLHKVIQAFIDFVESTSKRAKAASETKPGD
jgi:hypothetical protein